MALEQNNDLDTGLTESLQGVSALTAEADGQPGLAAQTDLNALLQSVPGLQSQFDRAISKALNTAHAHWERGGGSVTAEQERELNEREQALVLRERRTGALTTLGERGLPAELAACLSYDNDESVTRGIDALESAIQKEAQRLVQERLKGAPPKSGVGTGYASQMRAALGLK